MVKEAIILAAGYGTRLGKAAGGKPKPLVEIAPDKPVIDYIIERLERAGVRNVYVVTNNSPNNYQTTSYESFLEWERNLRTSLEIKVINDGTSRLEERLGAIGDINYVLQQQKLQGPLMIVGGDNLFEFELAPMVESFRKNQKNLVALSEETDLEKLKRLGVVRVDNKGRIVFFEEKPKDPSTTLFSTCIYIFTSSTLRKIPQYLAEGNDPDKPGSFIQWLYTRQEVYGHINGGSFIDIGTPEALEEARNKYITVVE